MAYSIFVHGITFLAALLWRVRVNVLVSTVLILVVGCSVCLILLEYELSDISIYEEFFLDGVFRNVSQDKTDYEIGWRLLNAAWASMHLSFDSMRVTVTLFYIYSLYSFIRLHTERHLIIFAVCVSFTFYPESYLLRSSIASALGLFALSKIADGKSMAAAIFIALAITFHVAAGILLPLLLTKAMRLPWKVALTILMLVMALALMPMSLGSSLLVFASELPLPEYITKKMILYLDPRRMRPDEFIAPIFFFYSALTVGFIWKARNSGESDSFFLAAVYALSVMVLFWDVPALSERTTRLLLPVFFVLMGRITEIIRPSEKIQAYSVLLIIANVNIYRVIPKDILIQ